MAREGKTGKVQVEKRLMSVEELARYVCLSKAKVYELASQRRIPSVKLDGKLLFEIAEVDKWIEQSKRPAVEH